MSECFKEYFIFNSVKGVISHFNKNNYYIYILYPSYPSTVYEIYPKMYFEEYLCLISSVFSLWFGFSILMFTDFCHQIANQMKIYFNNNFVNNMKITMNFVKQNNTKINLQSKRILFLK